MISLFPKTRSYFILGTALAVLAAGAFVYDGRSYLFAGAVFLGIFLVVYLVMQIWAVALNRQLLGMLYISLQPDKFAQIYEELLKTRLLRKNVRFTMSAYLSNAYAAQGKFEKALQILDNMPVLPKGRQAEGRALAACNKCSIYLNMADLSRAESSYELYAAYNSSTGKTIDGADILRIKMSTARGNASKADADYIREKLKSSTTPLNKAELRLLLGQIYEALGEKQFARSYYKEAAESGSRLWLSKKAKELMKNL